MSYLNPVDTGRRFNVYKTSTGEDDVPFKTEFYWKLFSLNSCKTTRKLSITEGDNSNVAGASLLKISEYP